MKKTLASTLLAALLMSMGTAFAHDDATLDATASPHGGQLRMAGIYHYELVLVKDSKTAKDNSVVVYLTDHAGAKFPSDGATGTATLLGASGKATATLQPDGDNRLKGIAKYASTPDTKVVLSIALPGRTPEQARFTPFTHKDMTAKK
ncbi:MAG: hypothetical protein ABI641_07725 [Caldimonas sp.]